MEQGDDGRAPTTGGAPPPLSRLLRAVEEGGPAEERVTFHDLARQFGDRAFGALAALLALGGLLPGAAMVFGVLLLVLGLQMGLGRREPSIPKTGASWGIRRRDVGAALRASSPWIERAERWVRPRAGFFTTRGGEALCGWLIAYAALMMILPGPMTNGPPAFGVIVMGVAMAQGDAKATGVGAAITALGCLVATGVLVTLGAAAIFAWRHVSGG